MYIWKFVWVRNILNSSENKMCIEKVHEVKEEMVVAGKIVCLKQ